MNISLWNLRGISSKMDKRDLTRPHHGSGIICLFPYQEFNLVLWEECKYLSLKWTSLRDLTLCFGIANITLWTSLKDSSWRYKGPTGPAAHIPTKTTSGALKGLQYIRVQQSNNKKSAFCRSLKKVHVFRNWLKKRPSHRTKTTKDKHQITSFFSLYFELNCAKNRTVVSIERKNMFVPKPGPIWHQFQSTGSHYNGKKRRGQRQTGPVVLLRVFASSLTDQYPLVYLSR